MNSCPKGLINSKLNTWKDRVSKRKQFPNGNKTVSIRNVNSFQTETTPIKDNIKDNIKTIAPISKKGKVNNKIKIPDWLDLEVWNELKKYRKAKFTFYAQKLAITKLEKLKNEGHDPTLVIQQTILRGWSGLFPIKEDYNQEETLAEWTKRVSQT